MTEQLSQFVLFGNFSSVNFDSLSKLTELKNKYGFSTNATNDIIIPSQNLDNQGQIIASQNFIQNMRPVFQTEDNSSSVFFGSSRIHIERRNYDSNSYEVFNDMAIDIVKNLMENLDLKFIRIALNGQILLSDKKFMNELYQRLFNQSDLYSKNSDEWQLRIVSKENDETLKCGINKIISYNRTSYIDVSTEKMDRLQIGYDFNTFFGIDKVFSIEEINYFNKQATEYRALVISGK